MTSTTIECDNENHRVQKFDKDGNYILQWGSECSVVRAMDCGDADGNCYVTDDGNPYVQKLYGSLMKFGGDAAAFQTRHGYCC
ncbi:MAG: hypothetical protein IPG44_17470 [Anaerolineales bacterium]|nr:hypothetical protein [Anaerolineales bacterium]